MIQAFRSREFVMFLLTGGIAAAVNIGSRMIYNLWVSYSIAIIMAYVTGMITAFILARMFVFKDSQQPIHHSAFFFIVINMLAVLQTWLVSVGLAYYLLPWIGIEKFRLDIAHVIGVAVPVFSSYIGHKRFSFR